MKNKTFKEIKPLIMKNNNEEVLNDLIEFCRANPDLRFWQAVYNWLGLVGIGGIWIDGKDPFHWRDKYE